MVILIFAFIKYIFLNCCGTSDLHVNKVEKKIKIDQFSFFGLVHKVAAAPPTIAETPLMPTVVDIANPAAPVLGATEIQS